MTRRSCALAWSIAVLSAAGFAACKKQPGPPSASPAATPPPPAMQAMAEDFLKLYHQVGQAQKEGDLSRYRSLRDPEEFAKTERILAAQGKDITPEVLQSFAEYWPDLENYQTLECKTSGDWTRLVLWSDSLKKDEADVPRIHFIVLLFRRRSDGWKLSRMGRIGQPMKEGPPQLAEADLPEELKLPSSPP